MVNKLEVSVTVDFLWACRLKNAPTTEAEKTGVIEMLDLLLRTEPTITGPMLLMAAMDYVKVNDFWPTPMHLIQTIRAEVENREADGLPLLSAASLWPRVCKTVGSLGRSCKDWQERLPVWMKLSGIESVAVVEAVEKVGYRTIAESNSDWERSKLGTAFEKALKDSVARITHTSQEREAKVLAFPRQ